MGHARLNWLDRVKKTSVPKRPECRAAATAARTRMANDARYFELRRRSFFSPLTVVELAIRSSYAA
jgi:hypothetical protein